MKLKFLTLLFTGLFSLSFSQIKIMKREDISKINTNWRLSKTTSGTYGIADKSGKTIVQPVYSKINKFGEYAEDLALVKNVSDGYGFIDKSGKEVIPARYELQEIKTNFTSLRKKYME
ncbi:WG repeat-containing protein [Chryseobacterium sp. NRRL B-14859]|nr:WG repeat-containing protein [Chryseobacterium sp. G0240]ROI01414.1 WG repeat-containing protein [Chryseobacterium sp. G0240]